MVPRYSEKGEDRTAALVWVGDDRARPQYIGQASLTWSGEMNNKLKQWLAEKQTDLHIFKALVRLNYTSYQAMIIPRTRRTASAENGVQT